MEQAIRRRLAVGLLALLVLVGMGLGVGAGVGDEGSAAPSAPTGTTGTAPVAYPPPASATTRTVSPSPSTTPSYHSSDRYTRRQTGGSVRGHAGQLMTYRVEVEQGAGVTTREFATVIDEALRHRRGWTAGGHWRFQRVVRAQPDLTIRLATPKTVDLHCEAAGASTKGYTSCRAGRYVYINLDRWHMGVPHVEDLDVYRYYLINHEVGHRLGKGHERCPAKGRLAPVMVQQTLGLGGCRPNAWPRTATGQMVSGPALSE